MPTALSDLETSPPGRDRRVSPGLRRILFSAFLTVVLFHSIVISLAWPVGPRVVLIAVGALIAVVAGGQILRGRRPAYLLAALAGVAGPLRLALGGRGELRATIDEYGPIAGVVTGVELALSLGLCVAALVAMRASGRLARESAMANGAGAGGPDARDGRPR